MSEVEAETRARHAMIAAVKELGHDFPVYADGSCSNCGTEWREIENSLQYGSATWAWFVCKGPTTSP